MRVGVVVLVGVGLFVWLGVGGGVVPTVAVGDGVTLGDAVILGVGVCELDGVTVGVVVTVGVGVGIILQYSQTE